MTRDSSLQSEEIRSRILNCLAVHAGLSVTQVSEHAEVSLTTARKYLKQLEEGGVAKKIRVSEGHRSLAIWSAVVPDSDHQEKVPNPADDDVRQLVDEVLGGDSAEKEIDAMRAVYGVLEPFDKNARARIIAWTTSKLGIPESSVF